MLYSLLALLALPLEAVDWKNRTYGMTTLVDGYGEWREYEALNAPHDTYISRLQAVHHTDLNGDKEPEAAVIMIQTSSPAHGQSTESTAVYIFGLRAGKVTQLGSRSLPHRVKSTLVKNGELILQWSTSDKRSCHVRWRWDGKEIVADTWRCQRSRELQRPATRD